ncbi:MAG: hypothetical protein Q7O66_08905 [Dehalococcoidia bacterium]|nr:hypothetical protein [Dehalococcoidia bacterium]
MIESKTLVLDPTGIEKIVEPLPLAPRPESLKGLTVGLVDYGRWRTFGVVLQHYRGVLKEQYGVGEVIHLNSEREANDQGISREVAVQRLATKCNVVMLGLGRGSCTSGLVRHSIEFEKRGVPAVTFVTDWFLSMAEKVSKGAGLPNPNLVAVPHPFDGLPDAEAIEIADKLLGKAIAAITAGPVVAE